MSQNTLQDMGHAIDVVWYALWYREEATLFINSGAKWTHGWYVVKDKKSGNLQYNTLVCWDDLDKWLIHQVHLCSFMIPASLFYEVNAPLFQVCYKP